MITIYSAHKRSNTEVSNVHAPDKQLSRTRRMRVQFDSDFSIAFESAMAGKLRGAALELLRSLYDDYIVRSMSIILQDVNSLCSLRTEHRSTIRYIAQRHFSTCFSKLSSYSQLSLSTMKTRRLLGALYHGVTQVSESELNICRNDCVFFSEQNFEGDGVLSYCIQNGHYLVDGRLTKCGSTIHLVTSIGEVIVYVV